MPERYTVGKSFLDDENLLEKLVNTPIKIYFFLLMLCSLIVVGYCYVNYYGDEFYENIWVEAHGMLFDLFVFGIIYTWISNRSEKRNDIKREVYLIDDFRNWHQPEAASRIAASIKRLNQLKVSVIKLSDCYLERANLDEVNLEGAYLVGANMKKASLKFSNLRNSDLRETDLRGIIDYRTNFEGAQYNSMTQFDKNFNPEARKMINLDKDVQSE
jgi:hypothetical protein